MKISTYKLYLGLALIYALLGAYLISGYSLGDIELLLGSTLFLLGSLNLLIYSKLLKIEERLKSTNE